MTNPFVNLAYEFPLQSLGDDFYEIVQPDQFPDLQLRFRNDDLLSQLGLNSQQVEDEHLIDFLGRFDSDHSCLALKYHGHQFGQYNPYLGDGRGFLYGQIRGQDERLYDLGTKGSGKTPFSQSGDGKLTVKGGIREVLAAEMLHRLGVPTSRCFCLFETGETISRDDGEHGGAMMIRLSHSHLRFGSFERLSYYDRPDLIKILLDHVIKYYYSHLWGQEDQYIQFYAELVERWAYLAAQWMAAGFCHGVLNTDNMSITGESFDYGPYRFIDYYNPYFTAAPFDQKGRYSYRNQPSVCQENLHLLQSPLSNWIPINEMEKVLDTFSDYYSQFYRTIMINKLGFDNLPLVEGEELLSLTLQFLFNSRFSYSHFFQQLSQQFSSQWLEDSELILNELNSEKRQEVDQLLQPWRNFYHYLLSQQSPQEINLIRQRLNERNTSITLLHQDIEQICQAILEQNNWELFNKVIEQLQSQTSVNFFS
ncbi:MAG: YdiU family protein [Microcystaceae cyanobacterium]